jgi:putative oligomerization/nucleic acid binding protein
MWMAKDNPPWFVKIFPIVWTLIAASICIYHLSNLFRERGVADRVVETDQSDSTLSRTEHRLKELSDLRAKNLITEEEYQQRRTAILNET